MAAFAMKLLFASWAVYMIILDASADRPPGAGPLPSKHALDVLLQAATELGGAGAQRQKGEAGSKLKIKTPNGANPAGWFGDFSQEESTFSYDGLSANRNENPDIEVLDGWNPQAKNPYTLGDVAAKFFTESESGGPKEAFQTVYPAVPIGIAGNQVPTGKFFVGTGDVLQQVYRSPHAVSQTGLPAGWFDDSVNQIDGFGREKLPGLGSPRNYLGLTQWEERSVNTTLACDRPGCTATVSLRAPYNPKTEFAKDCRLSVMFHPTDFDDWYGGEKVSWVQVNGRDVSSDCHLFSDGCNMSAARPLLPCVDAVPVDFLMPQDGILTVSSKIPEVVDECPHNGNFLSAVPMLTCLVAPKEPGSKPVNVANLMSTCVTEMPLQCPTKGCAAEVAMPFDPTCASLGKCTLSVIVNQTDFDNMDGTPELIEYIKVDGKEVATDLKPGHNPCKSQWHGDPLKRAALAYTALDDYDVTSQVLAGTLRVEGKISLFVDECGSNGNLFDAIAKVTCSRPDAPKVVAKKAPLAAKKAALLSQSMPEVAEAASKVTLRGRGSLLAKMLQDASM